MKRIVLLSVFVLLVIIACGEDRPRSPLAPVMAPAANASADLDQCANGPVLSPVNCTAASEWVNGNLGSSKAT